MKIGILTYYGDLNCGTNLQAYATLLAVKSVYPNDIVEIIPFHGFRPRIMPYKSFSLLSIINDFKRIYKYIQFKKQVLCVTEKDIVLNDVATAKKNILKHGYDIIYVGADTILELDRLPTNYDGLSAYWLTNINAKKILIAASSKNVEYDKLSSNQRQEMEIAINQFAFMGIRDQGTKELLSHFSAKQCIHYVPDPTFNLDIDYSFVESYLIRKDIIIPKKSVFIHTFGDDNWAEETAKILRKNGYLIVTPRPVKWADHCFNDMSPFEQLGIYRYFEFVITHRFHDGVFCLKNNTPFLLYEKGNGHATINGDSKFTSLLKDFDLYPDNFIGRGTDVTADMILKKQQNAIRNFKQKESVIKQNIKIKRDEYLNFLKITQD